MNDLRTDIILGTGADRPGVAVYDPAGGAVGRILSLAKGQSVYALDVSADEQTIAVGTKAGSVYTLTRRSAKTGDDYQVEPLDHGASASVLSVCFADESTLAVTDTVGRCVLWQWRQRQQVALLPGRAEAICTLFRLDGRHLAGLSLSGELLVWDWAENRLVDVLEVPRPPEHSALIKAVYWPQADSWVWPGRLGMIVSLRWRHQEVRAVRAHGGDFYAVAVCGGELLTVGMTDGSVQRWQPGASAPAGRVEAPAGVIAAAVWGQPPESRLVLIDEAGRAGLYAWTRDRMTLADPLGGGNYRVALGPDLQKIECARRRHAAARARELAGHMCERIQRRDGGELEGDYQELIALGYEPTALGLRAQEARGKNDIVGELKAYDALARMVADGQVGLEPSLLRYASLLEVVWQPQRACAIYRRLLEIHPDHAAYGSSLRRASEMAKRVERGDQVAVISGPLTPLVRSAMLLGEAFTGRYLIRPLGTPMPCGVVIPPSEFVAKYTQIAQTDPQISLPRAIPLELQWVSKDTVERVATILFKNEDPRCQSRLELGLKFFDAGLQTVLARVLLFHAEKRPPDLPAERHNQAILGEVQRTEGGSLVHDGWIQMVDRTISHVLRRLIARGSAERNR